MNSFFRSQILESPKESFVYVVGRTIYVLHVKAQESLGFKICARTMTDLEYWADAL